MPGLLPYREEALLSTYDSIVDPLPFYSPLPVYYFHSYSPTCFIYSRLGWWDRDWTGTSRWVSRTWMEDRMDGQALCMQNTSPATFSLPMPLPLLPTLCYLSCSYYLHSLHETISVAFYIPMSPCTTCPTTHLSYHTELIPSFMSPETGQADRQTDRTEGQ